MRNVTLIVLVLALLLAGCGAPGGAGGGEAATGQAGGQTGAEAPAVDLATTQTSAGGRYTVTYKSELQPLAINQLHAWTLHVETSDGAPLDDATVTVDGGMPAHNHGMPTQPLVTPLGGGDYQVEGMKFQMPGLWTVTVAITDTAGSPDQATFNLMLD